MEHLYPQVRPSCGAEPREAGGYPSLALQRLRIGFLRSRVWEEVAVGLRWQVGPAAKGEGTWGMLTGSSVKFSVPRFWGAG